MKPRLLALAALLLPALLAGCGGRGESLPVVDGVLQTRVPGQERTGGGTSGAVIAAERSAGVAPAEPGPAGTPGIPLGSGGNTGGTEMGAVAMGDPTTGLPGTTAGSAPRAAASGAAPAAAPASSVAPDPGETRRAEVALADTIDAIAKRWRTRAAEQGWPMYPPTPVDPLASIEASATGSAPSGQPQGRMTAPGAAAPMTSEKDGSAAPSPDVKQATKPRTQPSVKARAPAAAN